MRSLRLTPLFWAGSVKAGRPVRRGLWPRARQGEACRCAHRGARPVRRDLPAKGVDRRASPPLGRRLGMPPSRPAGSRPCAGPAGGACPPGLQAAAAVAGMLVRPGSRRAYSEPALPAVSSAPGQRLRRHWATLPRAVPFAPATCAASRRWARLHACDHYGDERRQAVMRQIRPLPPSAARRLHGEPARSLHPTSAASLPSAAVTQSRHHAFGWSSGCPLPTCGTRRCGSAGRGCTGRTLCGTRLDWPRTLGNRKSIPLQPAPARRGPT